jgi:hypothetical protein
MLQSQIFTSIALPLINALCRIHPPFNSSGQRLPMILQHPRDVFNPLHQNCWAFGSRLANRNHCLTAQCIALFVRDGICLQR